MFEGSSNTIDTSVGMKLEWSGDIDDCVSVKEAENGCGNKFSEAGADDWLHFRKEVKVGTFSE